MISTTFDQKVRTETITGSTQSYQLVPVHTNDDNTKWTAPENKTFPQSVRDHLGDRYVPKTKIVDYIDVHSRQYTSYVAITDNKDRLYIKDHNMSGYPHNDCLLNKPFILNDKRKYKGEFGTVIKLETSRGELKINPDQTPELDHEHLEIGDTYQLSYTSKTWTGRQYDRQYTFESVSFE